MLAKEAIASKSSAPETIAKMLIVKRLCKLYLRPRNRRKSGISCSFELILFFRNRSRNYDKYLPYYRYRAAVDEGAAVQSFQFCPEQIDAG